MLSEIGAEMVVRHGVDELEKFVLTFVNRELNALRDQ